MPRKTALVCGADRHSYAELEARASQVARQLHDAGVRPLDRVAICLENSADAVVALFGVLKAGAVFLVVGPHARVEYRNQLIADSGASAVIERNTSGTSVVTGIDGRRHAPVTADIDPDLAALVYTSGSTGVPKGVMLTHRNITFAAESIGTYLGNTEKDVILSVLPLAFTYGLGQVTTAFHAGATLVLERSFAYPRAVLNTMRRERVTGLPIVPTIATLLQQQDLRMHRLPHLRYVTNAAAALPVARTRRLRTAFPHAKLFLMYGQTECQRVCYLPPDLTDSVPESVGIPIPGTSAEVTDAAGRPVSPEVVGELVVRGPHVMKGYWNNPEATAKALQTSANGETVLLTGDLFRTDARGLLHFVERRDDVVKVRGEKVAPRQVEEVIARLSGVAEVSVYGVPDDVSGEAIAASVRLCDGALISPDQIRRHCLASLEAYMVPKIVDVREALPTTPNGKISRRALRLLTRPRGESAA